MAQNAKAAGLAVPQFVKGPLSQVRRQALRLGREVNVASRAPRKQLDGLVLRAGKRAEAALTKLNQTLEGLRGSALKASGLASSDDLAKLTREVSRLAKRFDAAIPKAAPKA